MNPLANWTGEQRSAYLYRACARAETAGARAELFQRLAGEAEAQAAIWRAQLTARGHPAPPPYVPDGRTELVARLVHWLGPRRMKSVLAAMKVRGMAVYGAALHTESAGTEAAGGAPGPRRRNAAGGNLRTTVICISDGLVANTCLILGVAGATTDPRLAFVAGVAGLAAGALAMAIGEYLSARSQLELFDHQVGPERAESKQHPQAEAQELALIYAAKGLAHKEANRLAKRIVADPQYARDTLARDELGLDPADLQSPLGAATGTLLAFALGAAVPLLAFLFAPGAMGLYLGLGAAAVALLCVGATFSLFTGRSAWYAGLRMLALGSLAGTVTFGIGRLVGVALG